MHKEEWRMDKEGDGRMNKEGGGEWIRKERED